MKVFNRLLSALLALIMVATMLPASVLNVLATEETDEETQASGGEAATDEESLPTWEYAEIEGGVELTKYNGSATDVYIPATVDGKNVLKLADGLFENYDSLNSATLAEGIVEIGARAFYDCDNLVCVLISEMLTGIGAEAFYGCDAFNSIILYDAVTVIGENAFSLCPVLVVYCNTDSTAHTYVTENAIAYKLMDADEVYETYVQDGVTYHIQDGEAYAIGYDQSATEVVIPPVVKGCPVVELRETFSGYTGLEKAAFPGTVRSIAGAFKGCSALSEITLNEGLLTIGDNSFEGCSSLLYIDLPDSLVSFGYRTFYNSGLKSIEVPAYTAIGNRAFENCHNLESAVIEDGITHIGQGAFYNCSRLANVRLPETLLNIGPGGTSAGLVFSHCTALESIVIPEGVEIIGSQSFEYCSNLKSISFPDSVNKIEICAFQWCENLKEIVLPGNSVTIGDDCFYIVGLYDFDTLILRDGASISMNTPKKLPRARYVSLPGSIKTVSKALFENERAETVLLGEGLQTIESGVYANTSNLKSVIIPKSVTKMYTDSFAPSTILMVYEGSYAHQFAVANNLTYFVYDGTNAPQTTVIDGVTYYINDETATAISFDGSVSDLVLPETVEGKMVTGFGAIFKNCTTLKSIVIPKGVTSVASKAFYGCSALTNVTLPDSLKTIGSYAFYDCKVLANISIPDAVTSIGDYAFYYCHALSNITIPSKLTYLGTYSFFRTDGLATEITIPGTVNTIGKYAFGYSKLQGVTIADGVKIIDECAFQFCGSLSSLYISSTLTDIKANAFGGCSALKNIDFPDSITLIGNGAFSGCSSLKSVSLPEGLIYLYLNAFNNCTSLQSVYIPGSIGYFPLSPIFKGCSSLTTVVLGEGLHTIQGNVFTGCTSVKELTIPSTLKVIDARLKCSALETVHISEGVMTICAGSFLGCYNMQTVVIPRSVTEMYTDSFEPGTVLLVYENSYAHQFAQENGLLYFLYDGYNRPQVVLQDGITYCILEDRAIAIAYDGSATEITVPAQVSGVPVTELHATFNGCAEITGVSLPDTIKTIGASAFYGCTNLAQLKLPASLEIIDDYAFYNCTMLVEVAVPESVKRIGLSAFRYCSALEKINLPKNLEVLGNDAFSDCIALQVIVIPDTISAIESGTFSGCVALETVTIGSNVKRIGNYAFFRCFALTSISIPESVAAIEVSAFDACSALSEVLFNEGLVSISHHAFYNSGISSLYLPKTVTSIGSYAFASCEALSEVTLSEGLVSIEDHAFYYSGIIFVSVPNSVTTLGEYAFARSSLTNIELGTGITKIPYRTFEHCYSLTSILVPSNVEEIRSEAFYYCTNLKTITLSEGLLTLSLDYCTGLKEIILPDSLTGFSLEGCTGLTRVVVPQNVVSLYNGCFEGCTSIESIILQDGIERIYPNAFTSCVNMKTIYIPESVTTLYKDAFTSTMVLLVHKDSYAHTFAVENDLLYFVLGKVSNPEIAYGMGLSGTVTYSDGSLAVGAQVEILYDDGTVKESVLTDENGVYTFTYAEVGRYVIRVIDEQDNTASTAVSVKRISVFDVYPVGDRNMTLKKSYTISGSVSDAPATVVLTDLQGSVLNAVEVGEDGLFAIQKVHNGSYILKAYTEKACVSTQITVFESDLTDIYLEFEEVFAEICGIVKVKTREKEHHVREWVEVKLYNSNGEVIARTESDEEGAYSFENVPMGEYFVVAHVEEQRGDKRNGKKRNFLLCGYAYVNVTEGEVYHADDIILRETSDDKVKITGTVYYDGTPTKAEVKLLNVWHHEGAKNNTGEKGEYRFNNVHDGLYFIVATSRGYGAGYSFFTVIDGVVHGSTDVHIEKSEWVRYMEEHFKNDIPHDLCTKENIGQYRERIAKEKHRYDCLPEHEKRQCGEEYLEWLNKYVEWLANINYTTDDEDVKMENGGFAVSGGELENEDVFDFHLNVEKSSSPVFDGNGSDAEYLDNAMNDAAGNKEIVQYYEINMCKRMEDGREIPIESVVRDTDATGKIRITITIPEEHRGHKHYHILHEHHGEVVTLADLDNDPNTITVEVDKFSTFALSATDEVLTETVYDAEDIDGDGSISINDVTVLLRYLSGETDVFPEERGIPDLDNDQTVSIGDVTKLLTYLSGAKS